MDCEVVRLKRGPAQNRVAAVYITNGKHEREEGDFILCTIPFPVLARIDASPAFSGEKQRAIRDTYYESSTKVLARLRLRPTRRVYWRSHSGGSGALINAFIDDGHTTARPCQVVSRFPRRHRHSWH
jgi:monoamine oxidase